MRWKRPSQRSDLQGNVWAFLGINHAQAVYQAILHTPGFIADTHDSSLDTGFFAKQPVLIFLWGPTMDPELVASVQRRAVLAGGHELEDALKQELLRQARLRWRAMRSQRPRGGTITKHHPHGRVWTDVRD
jgi:hypothetical protein